MANGDRRDRVERASVTQKRKQRRNEIRKGRGCPETHTRTKGKCGPICLPFGEASAGYLYDPSPQRCNVRYTEREGGGEVKSKSKEFPPATERAASYAKSVRYSD